MKTPILKTPHSSRKSAAVSPCAVLVLDGLITVFAYLSSLLILIIVFIVSAHTGPLANRAFEITGKEMPVKSLMLAMPKGITALLATGLSGEMAFGAFAEATLRGSSFPLRWLAGVSNDLWIQRPNFKSSRSDWRNLNRPDVRGWPREYQRSRCAQCAWRAFPEDFRFTNSNEFQA